MMVADCPIREVTRVRAAPTGYNYLSWIGAGQAETCIDGRHRIEQGALHLAGQIQGQDIEVIHRGPRLRHILAEFTATGMTRLIGVPGARIHGQTIGLARLAPEAALALDRALSACGPEIGDKLVALQSVLASLVETAAPPIAYLETAVGLIEESGGRMLVSDVARAADIGPRQLARRFREIVGCSTKHFAKVIQINTALAALTSEDPGQLTALCHEAGYYDQAHFAHVMHEFFGHGPTAFLESRHDVLTVFLGLSRHPG